MQAKLGARNPLVTSPKDYRSKYNETEINWS